MITGKKILVTGGAGFIGSHLVERLVQLNNEVIVLDNLITGKKANLTPVMGNITFVEGSITDSHLLKQLLQGVEYVFHLAALPSVPRSVKDPEATHEAGSTGTLRLLLAARDAGVKRLVYSSSSSVYGDSPSLPKEESMPINPLSPYALEKYAGERYCQLFTALYGFETVSLRYFNVFGPKQDPQSQYAAVIPKFITALLKGEQPIIYGDGQQTRDFTYVENVVQANLLAATAPQAAGKVVNIAGGKRITLLALVEMMNTLLGKSIQPTFTDPRPGDIKHSLASLANAETYLGYKPLISLEEGLQKTIAWFKAQNETSN